MADTINELELTVSRRIPAPRARVFDAWLSPRMLEKFMRPAGIDMPSRVTNDPVKGGRFSIIMTHRKRRSRTLVPIWKSIRIRGFPLPGSPRIRLTTAS